jgi:tryptophanyl-tRNA synthetase
MSKSLDNAVFLSDSAAEVKQRVGSAITDPERIRKTDLGHPDICSVYSYHQVFSKDEVPLIREECEGGKIGCVACKLKLTASLNTLLEPMRARRAGLENRPDIIWDILQQGTAKASEVASQTLEEVREAMKINYF